ncbi:hypothetical protein CBER1_07355 [Cercospora berteroae]|uniref:Azaphilone pigments biosynthesis cluster protein L N-terminal domain-containing protein n=1 Tax=Cercospora berteroae TaxID=357750 RepID=A0A2S6CL69_9PEZI|nr:hypothetical protein CBER1_07355 [Cercospora berteroae]
MAEIIGTAASVIQVAEAGFSLATTLYNYSKSVKSAEKDIKKIARDVNLTAKVLQRTHEQLKADVSGKSCTNEAIHDLEEVLEGCREAFQEVDDALTKSTRVGADGNFTISMTEKLKWPLRSSKLEVLRANLEKLKSTLLLMLSVLAYGTRVSQAAVAANMKVKVELTLDKLQVEGLIDAKNGAEERFEELRKKFEELELKASGNVHETDDIGVTAGGASANIAVALPGAEAPHNEITSIDSTDPSDSLAIALQHCASTVGFLALCIDSSTEQWRNTRTFQPHSIDISLHESVEVIRKLKEEAASHTKSKPTFQKLQPTPRHPAQSRETRARNRETSSHLSEACKNQSHAMRRVHFDEPILQGPGDPAIDWIYEPCESLVMPRASYHERRHIDDDLESSIELLPLPPGPSSDRPDTTHQAKARRISKYYNSPARKAEFDDLVREARSRVENETAGNAGGREELSADDDGVEFNSGDTSEVEAEGKELEMAECEEEAEAEAEAEAEDEEEDPDPEDAVEQLLQRWTGLVGV